MDCCGAPPNVVRRQSRSKLNAASPNDKTKLKGSFVATEKDQLLLDNQIQANNYNQGIKQAYTLASGSIIRQQDSDQEQQESSIVASTSVPKQSEPPTNDSTKRAKNHKLDPFADQSVSSSSSIDIEQFSEHPTNAIPSNEDPEPRSQTSEENERWYSAVGVDTQASAKMLSTTKIGDYARLEYSPVEDLDSVTTASARTGGSEVGGRRASAVGSTNSNQDSPKDRETELSRQVSQGMESSSISIASQLSNELQQSLTNMLEAANSPLPMFGTIGLPLGPSLESSVPDTRKTSPETTGAALTSQDSLSEASGPSSRPAPSETAGSITTTGAALVGDSTERDDLVGDSLPVGTRIRDNLDVKDATRVESPTSMATTISADLTNPTPTPSELSGTSSKRKRKLLGGEFLRKWRPRRKKKNKGDVVENK